MRITSEDRVHSSLVMSFASGSNVGIARNAEVVLVQVDIPSSSNTATNYFPRERLWEALINIANDRKGKGKNGAVVNMSFKLGDVGNTVFYDVLSKSSRVVLISSG